MVEPSVLRKLKKIYHVLKCMQILLLVMLSIWCVFGIISQTWFFAVMLFVNVYFLIVHFCAFSLNIRNTVFQEELILLYMFIPVYGILMVALWPDFKIFDMKNNASESQNLGESDKVQDTTQVDEGKFTFSIKNKTNETENLWEAAKNLNYIAINRVADTLYFTNKRDPEFLVLYFTILVTIFLFVIFQAALLILAWIINKQPVQELGANTGPQNEEEIPLQPGVQTNENLHLVQDSGEGPSSKVLQPSQNVLTNIKHKTSGYTTLKPSKDLEGINFDSLAKAGPSKAFGEPRTTSLEIEKPSINLSMAATSSHERNSLQNKTGGGTRPKEVTKTLSFDYLAKAGPSKAAEELKASSLELEKSSISLSKAAASSLEGDLLQPLSGVETYPKDVKGESSFDSLSKAAFSKAAEELRTARLVEMENPFVNLSTTAASSREEDSIQPRSEVITIPKNVKEANPFDSLAKAVLSKAAEELRTAPLEMENPFINLSTVAASLPEGDSLQPISLVGSLSKDVKEASS